MWIGRGGDCRGHHLGGKVCKGNEASETIGS